MLLLDFSLESMAQFRRSLLVNLIPVTCFVAPSTKMIGRRSSVEMFFLDIWRVPVGLWLGYFLFNVLVFNSLKGLISLNVSRLEIIIGHISTLIMQHNRDISFSQHKVDQSNQRRLLLLSSYSTARREDEDNGWFCSPVVSSRCSTLPSGWTTVLSVTVLTPFTIVVQIEVEIDWLLPRFDEDQDELKNDTLCILRCVLNIELEFIMKYISSIMPKCLDIRLDPPNPEKNGSLSNADLERELREPHFFDEHQKNWLNNSKGSIKWNSSKAEWCRQVILVPKGLKKVSCTENWKRVSIKSSSFIV